MNELPQNDSDFERQKENEQLFNDNSFVINNSEVEEELIDATAGFVTPQPRKLASRWDRLAASLLDGLFFLIVMVPLVFILVFTFAGVEDSEYYDVIASFASLLLYSAINFYTINKNSQTLGKVLLKIEVVDKSTLQPIGAKRYILRRLLPIYAIGSIPVVGGVLNFLNPLFIFRSQKNCLHDDIAGSRVVNSFNHE